MEPRKLKLTWALGFLLGCALCALGQDNVTTLTDFNVPEYDENGNLVSELLGESADILPDGRVRITKLQIKSYKNEEVDMSITAPECEYSEADKTAFSESDVRIARDNMVVTGTGFSWRSSDERLVIKSNVKVVLKNVRKHVKTGEKS